MYCNYCSKICKKEHNCGKSIVEETLLNVVGGETGLVKEILSLKRGLEKESLVIKLDRFSFLENFNKIKEMTLENTFDNKIKVVFQKYQCYLELDEPISLYDLTTEQMGFLETLDLAFNKFLNKRGEKTNKRLEKRIKEQINSWNFIFFNDKTEDKLLFSRYGEIAEQRKK